MRPATLWFLIVSIVALLSISPNVTSLINGSTLKRTTPRPSPPIPTGRPAPSPPIRTTWRPTWRPSWSTTWRTSWPPPITTTWHTSWHSGGGPCYHRPSGCVPPYPWPPPGYVYPASGYCDPNDPYSMCWDPQCAPNCGYFVPAVTENATAVVTSVVTAPPSVVTAPPSTVVVTQLPPQTSPSSPAPDYTLLAVGIVVAAAIVAAGFMMRRRGSASPAQPGAAPPPAQVPSAPQSGLPYCTSCGKQIPLNSRFCEFCGSPQ